MSLLEGWQLGNRLPLTPSDGDAFYTMLATANQIASLEELPNPTFADPVTFLRDGKDALAVGSNGGGWSANHKNCG